MVPTSGLVFAVKTCVAARRISVEPSLSSTFSGLTLKCAQRIEHLLPRADRVLVARDADHAFFDGLELRLEGRPHAVLTAASPDRAGERRARADAGGLDELT